MSRKLRGKGPLGSKFLMKGVKDSMVINTIRFERLLKTEITLRLRKTHLRIPNPCRLAAAVELPTKWYDYS